MNSIQIQQICGVSGRLIANAHTTSCEGLGCALVDKRRCCVARLPCDSVTPQSEDAFCIEEAGNGLGNGLIAAAGSTLCQSSPCTKQADAATCCKPNMLCSSMNAVEIEAVCGASGSLIAEASRTFCDGTTCESTDKNVCCQQSPSGGGGSSGGSTTGGSTTGGSTTGGGTTGGGTTGGGTTGGTGGSDTGGSTDTKTPGTEESNRVCNQATCTCSNGVAATGDKCIYNNAENCLNCNKGYYHTITMSGMASCKPCETGYFQSSWESTATKCTKWTACSVADAQAGSSGDVINSGDSDTGGAGTGDSKPPVVTDFIVKHAIMLSGIDSDTFNLNLNIEKSFVDAIVQVLGVDVAAVQHVRAVSKQKNGGRRRRFLSATKTCFVLYELVFDSKKKADAMEAQIEDSAGLFQTDPNFTLAFKSTMKKNNVPETVVSSIVETKPALTATQQTRVDGVDSKSMHNMTSSDASMDGDHNGHPGGTVKTSDVVGIVVGVVILVLALIGVGVGAVWYFFGHAIKETCLKRPDPFEHRDSIHVTNTALVELSVMPGSRSHALVEAASDRTPPNLPVRLNPIRRQSSRTALEHQNDL